MRALPKAVSALLAGSLLLVGCTGGSDEASSDSGAAAEPATAGGGNATTGETDPPPLESLRVAPELAVIRTADLQVRVDDVQAAADEAGRLARSVGGVVEAEDRTGSGSEGSATVQLRVPPKQFDAALAALAALGDERSRRLSSEDVTDQVVDLEARLATQRASVDRVRALLAEAEALGEVVVIEAELTKRTADLEALEARLASLSARVELSTIVLRLDSEGGPVVGQALGFGDGLRAGWSALTATARLVAVTSGALLPFLPLLLVAGYLLMRSRNRRAQVV